MAAFFAFFASFLAAFLAASFFWRLRRDRESESDELDDDDEEEEDDRREELEDDELLFDDEEDDDDEELLLDERLRFFETRFFEGTSGDFRFLVSLSQEVLPDKSSGRQPTWGGWRESLMIDCAMARVWNSLLNSV